MQLMSTTRHNKMRLSSDMLEIAMRCFFIRRFQDESVNGETIMYPFAWHTLTDQRYLERLLLVTRTFAVSYRKFTRTVINEILLHHKIN